MNENNKRISKFILVFFGTALLAYFSYQYFRSKSLDGDWIAVGNTYYGQNHWVINSDSNLTIRTYLFSELFTERYKIEKTDSGTFNISSHESQHKDELGTIEESKKDTVRFSSGLELIRIKPTNSDISLTQFRELLKNSIIELDYKYKDWVYTQMYNEYTVRKLLFPNESADGDRWPTANEHINTTKVSGAVFTEFDPFNVDSSISNVSRLNDWGVYSFNGLFVLQYGFDHYIHQSFIIHQVSDSSFNGKINYEGNYFPFSGKVIPKISKRTVLKLNSQIEGNDWNILTSSILNLAWEYRLDYDLEDLEKRKSYNDELIIISKKSDLKNNSFSFNFTNDGIMEIYLHGILVGSMKWELAPDGNFLFMFPDERYSSSDYIEIEKLNDIVSKLSFILPVYIQQTDSTYTEEFARFELIAQ